MTLRCSSFAFVVLAVFSHSSLARAAPKAKSVKVCVRIEEKSWARDGSAPEPSAPRPGPDIPAKPERDIPSPEKKPASEASPAAPRDNAIAQLPPEKAEDDRGKSPEGGTVARFGPAPPAGATLPPDPPPFAVRPSAPNLTRMVDAKKADYGTVDPILYLKRLLEYHVTHEPGFESVDKGCAETVVVELYSVRNGWTAFARYSGNAREEKVDVVRLDELGVFAERVATALLRDKTVSETLTRTTVLRADSDEHIRQVKVRTHFLLGMGSGVRVGSLPTAPSPEAPAQTVLRAETPLGFAIGVRNKFRGWALDATGRLDVGVGDRAARLSAGGGHVDYSAGLGAGLDFLGYAAPEAVNTLYYGGGGSFEVSRYQSQGARDANGVQPEPSSLWGGGLAIDLVFGYEFARTSTLHFFVQSTIALPAYVFDAQNSQSAITSYIPSASFTLGLLL
jgi:hypothetical protein